MTLKNTTLDDISALIGFSATIRLAAWYGDLHKCYVPKTAKEGHHLAALLGGSAAEKLTKEWGGKHLSIPRLQQYEVWSQRQKIGELLQAGVPTQHIAVHVGMSERRVQQICRELEVAGLIPPIGPGKRGRPKLPGKTPHKNGGSILVEDASPDDLPAA